MATITPIRGKPFTPSKADRPGVLVVEDDALVALMIKDFLDQLGCAVVGPVGDAKAAVAAIGTSSVVAAIVDHVCIGHRDYVLEDALSSARIPFGFVVGTPNETADRFRHLPYVVKPFSIEQLYELIAELFRMPG